MLEQNQPAGWFTNSLVTWRSTSLPKINAMTRILAVALLFLGLPLAARAEMTASELIAEYHASSGQERKVFEAMVRATENGMAWSAAYSKHHLYCVPEQLTLAGNQEIDILERASSDRWLASQPYGLALLMALIRTFPCANK
jgi:hypothetical protein